MLKALLIILFFIYGCSDQTEYSEMSNKPDYSILQSYEYNYQEINNDIPYMICKKALNTNATVIAFPIKSVSKGYVVILAKSEGCSAVKVLPDADFIVTQEAYTEIKKQVDLSVDVDRFISAHINQ